MKTAQEHAHEVLADGVTCSGSKHTPLCDDLTAVIRAAQIDALDWAFHALPHHLRDRIAELEAEAARPAGEVG